MNKSKSLILKPSLQGQQGSPGKNAIITTYLAQVIGLDPIQHEFSQKDHLPHAPSGRMTLINSKNNR